MKRVSILLSVFFITSLAYGTDPYMKALIDSLNTSLTKAKNAHKPEVAKSHFSEARQTLANIEGHRNSLLSQARAKAGAYEARSSANSDRLKAIAKSVLTVENVLQTAGAAFRNSINRYNEKAKNKSLRWSFSKGSPYKSPKMLNPALKQSLIGLTVFVGTITVKMAGTFKKVAVKFIKSTQVNRPRKASSHRAPRIQINPSFDFKSGPQTSDN